MTEYHPSALICLDVSEQRYVEITVVMFGCHTKNNNDDGKPSHQTDWMQFIQDINSKAENLFVCNYRSADWSFLCCRIYGVFLYFNILGNFCS